MKFSPADHKALIERAAEIVAERVLASMDDPEDLIVLPVPTVASMTQMAKPTVKRRMETIAHGPGSAGVRLSELRRYLDSRTKAPTSPNAPQAAGGEQVPPLAIVGTR